MKQKDIAMIIAIAAVSGVLSLVLARMVFATPSSRQQKVETVEAISTEFTPPSNQFFNTQSIDPTQLIQIGDNSNNAPFSAAN